MIFPEELLYTKEHEWLKLLNEEEALIGVTAFAQKELGDIVFVEVLPNETSLKINDVFGTVEAVKTVSDLFIPVSGVILGFNEELFNHAEFINSEPYGNGWIVKIKITKPHELEKLMSAEEYKKEIGL